MHDRNVPGLHLFLGDSQPGATGATWTAPGQLGLAASALDVDFDGEEIVRNGRYVRFV